MKAIVLSSLTWCLLILCHSTYRSKESHCTDPTFCNSFFYPHRIYFFFKSPIVAFWCIFWYTSSTALLAALQLSLLEKSSILVSCKHQYSVYNPKSIGTQRLLNGRRQLSNNSTFFLHEGRAVKQYNITKRIPTIKNVLYKFARINWKFLFNFIFFTLEASKKGNFLIIQSFPCMGRVWNNTP